MSLVITIQDNILTVIEYRYTFKGTQTRYWYYDIEKWLVSSHGREGDKPDRTMTPSDIEWVQKHYLPKVS